DHPENGVPIARRFTVIRHAQERIAAARLWIRMLLIIGFVVDFFSNLLEADAFRWRIGHGATSDPDILIT
ncbi:MAG: hypothetical protein WAJ91_17220, partial [Rhodoplanes sp.]